MTVFDAEGHGREAEVCQDLGHYIFLKGGDLSHEKKAWDSAHQVFSDFHLGDIAVVSARFNKQTRILDISSGGDTGGLVYRPRTGEFIWGSSLVMHSKDQEILEMTTGNMSEIGFNYYSVMPKQDATSLQLQKGDQVLLTTDGLFERASFASDRALLTEFKASGETDLFAFIKKQSDDIMGDDKTILSFIVE